MSSHVIMAITWKAFVPDLIYVYIVQDEGNYVALDIMNIYYK